MLRFSLLLSLFWQDMCLSETRKPWATWFSSWFAKHTEKPASSVENPDRARTSGGKGIRATLNKMRYVNDKTTRFIFLHVPEPKDRAVTRTLHPVNCKFTTPKNLLLFQTHIDSNDDNCLLLGWVKCS